MNLLQFRPQDPNGLWIYRLPLTLPYTKNHQLRICPSHKNYCTAGGYSPLNIDESGNTSNGFYNSYQLNSRTAWWRTVWTDGGAPFGPGGHPMADVNQPASTVLLWEGCAPDAWCDDHYYGWTADPWPCQVRLRHNGGLNFAFADGHVKWMRWNKVTPDMLSGNGGDYSAPTDVPDIDYR